MRPVGTKIFIKKDASEHKTDSGIIILDGETKQVHPTAEVIAVGARVTKLKTGDKIMFERGHDIEYIGDIGVIDTKSVIAKL